MRSVLLAVVLSIVGCATSSGTTGARPVNVHVVRMEIKSEIESTPGEAGPRKIVSMGKVRAESAVVYTQREGQPRQEETWAKGPTGWTLTNAVAVDGGAAGASTAAN
jgi:hypothetical protein